MEQKNAISRRLFFGGMFASATASLLGPAALSPARAFAAPDAVAEKQAEADAAYEELLEKQAVLDRASNEYHRAVEAQQQAHAMMEDARQRIAGESARIAEYQDQLSIRARDMYRTGTRSYLDVLLGATTFEDFATNWGILNSLNASDAALVKRSKESRQAMANAKATYAIEKENASREAAAAKAVHDEAMQTVAEIEATYESLSAEAAALLHEREVAQASITDEALISQLIEQGTAATEQWAAAQGVQRKVDDTPAPDADQAKEEPKEEPKDEAAEEPKDEAAEEPKEEPAAEPEPEPEPEAQPEPEPEPEVQPEEVVQEYTQPAQETEPVVQQELAAEPEVQVAPEQDYTTQYVDQTVAETDYSADTSSDLGSRVVNNSLQYLGWDYVWGGKSPASGGFDCSGFVGYVYDQAGSYAPSWTGSLINYGEETTNPQPGDICVIHEESGEMRQHTGIYYGNGQMVHASTYGTGVIISPVQEGMTYRHVE